MGDVAEPIIRVEGLDRMTEGRWVQLDEVIEGHQVVPLVMCCVPLNVFQQTVGLTFVPHGLQHDLSQGRRLRQIHISSPTAFSLLRGSRVVSGVDHPRKTKQRFRQG